MTSHALPAAIVGLLIVLTSAIFPLVVKRYDHLHTATNFHISALCLSDCVLGVTFTIVPVLRLAWPALGQSPGVCVAAISTSAFCLTMSNGVMFWLALDRRTALHHPLSYTMRVTASTVRWELLFTALPTLLLISFVTSQQLLTGPPLPDVIPRCFVVWFLVMGDGSALLNVINLIVICATMALSVDVLLVARRVLRAGVVAPHELTERARLRQHVRTFYYLLRVFVLYGVCLLPFCVYSLVRELYRSACTLSLDVPVDSEDLDPLWVALILLRGMFNVVDSWLYCSTPELRQAILHFCCGAHFELYP